jgi:ABC-type nickel/cobalt efflux system permease component RcnA
MRLFLFSLLLPLVFAPALAAHPIPNKNHDRSIVVRITAGALVVDYRLETDEANVAFDLPREAASGIKSREELLDAYSRLFADALGRNLDASLDKVELRFTCVRRHFVVTDHLRCEYRFEATWAPAPGGEHTVKFHECNFVDDNFSRLHVYLAAGTGVRLVKVEAPSAEMMNRPSDDRRPGEGDKLRRVAAEFTVADLEPEGLSKPAFPPEDVGSKEEPDGAVTAAKPAETGAETFAKAAPTEAVTFGKPRRSEGVAPPVSPPPEMAEPTPKAAAEPTLFELLGKLWDRLTDRNVLRNLLFETNQGLAVLLLVAALAGGAHALTPGHGKTVVAAYLVGQRGTYWHAVVLGLVTTLTHTAAVIVMAVLFLFLPGSEKQLLVWQGLIGGGLITALGLWLLYRRALGQADHFHLGGGHHHHHGAEHDHDHGYADHTHDEHGAVVPADGGRAGLWGVVTLGMSGGLLPCWDAVVFLGFAVSAGQARLGLPLILAFSAGLATVLVVLGLVVVGAKQATQMAAPASGRLNRLARALPILSAIVVTLMGLWLCREALNPH